MAHKANARLHLTSEANAAAKTNGAFDAAAPLYERVPWRARPPYEREEKDRSRATTSNLAMPLHVPATRCCKCCGEAAKLTAGHAVQGHQCCRLAPASAASTAGKLRSGTATRGQSADPSSIEPL